MTFAEKETITVIFEIVLALDENNHAAKKLKAAIE